MSTTTIYSDAYVVIVDHPRGIQTAPWLDEVTYLIDANGQTTAVLEQTEKPTSGVSLEPIPFTPVQAAVIKSATTSSPSAGGSTLDPSTVSSSPGPASLSPTLRIALAILGAVLILILAGVTWYLLRRRNINARARNDSLKLGSEDESRQPTPVTVATSSPKQLSIEARERTTPNLIPRSILKTPKPSDTNVGWLGTMQTMFGRTDNEEFKATLAENENRPRKKGVTFGENQVREFGRTPLPSRTASLISRNTEE